MIKKLQVELAIWIAQLLSWFGPDFVWLVLHELDLNELLLPILHWAGRGMLRCCSLKICPHFLNWSRGVKVPAASNKVNRAFTFPGQHLDIPSRIIPKDVLVLDVVGANKAASLAPDNKHSSASSCLLLIQIKSSNQRIKCRCITCCKMECNIGSETFVFRSPYKGYSVFFEIADLI